MTATRRLAAILATDVVGYSRPSFTSELSPCTDMRTDRTSRGPMRHTTLTDFRAHIARHLDAVENDRVELVVTRPNHEPCVVLPLAELEGLRETLHLLASRANAAHILESIAELEAGKAEPRRLAET